MTNSALYLPPSIENKFQQVQCLIQKGGNTGTVPLSGIPPQTELSPPLTTKASLYYTA